ncbi:sodium/proton antiporter, CPA1 family [Micromonospora pattaloongensis]|uniref:Sodium/proton antiporter, CPA1 family n=1 Tax=Micromonospora pattaloongensis TaxID=405436 RepID=A0A1H3R5V3_9ACTN|nr:cation:proton antiporter [Micromonospora pattaloongensis]SDZ20695.1 sodium/proton antiporter, CPA1 family [Micromonospora pattaloongensis]
MNSLLLGYALVGALAVLLALGSSAIRRTPFTEPMLALFLGVLAGPVLGLLDLDDRLGAALMREVSRALLAVSLMAVALRFPLAGYRRVLRPVLVLLTAGMVGMAVLSAGLAWLLLGVPLSLAALLGSCLSPTDPVLASGIVSGGPAERQLPARLRQVISGESGGNDGLAFPLVVLALAAVGARPWADQLVVAVWGVLGAVVVGVLLGWLAGRAVRAASRRETLDRGSLVVFAILLGIAALGIGQVFHTDDILAVFVTGLAYNRVIGDQPRIAEQKLDDALTRYLVLPLFFMLGVELPWRDWLDAGWRLPLFAVAVLLVRRLPVVAGLRAPLRLGWREVVFLGWFGPIGVSALFYLTFSADEGARDPLLWNAGSLVVVLSIVLHGATAMPGRRWYAAAGSRGDG